MQTLLLRRLLDYCPGSKSMGTKLTVYPCERLQQLNALVQIAQWKIVMEYNEGKHRSAPRFHQTNRIMTWHPPEESALLAVRRRVMNDDFEVSFSHRDFPQGTEAALNALDEAERIERLLSVFRLDSRIQYVNLTAHESPVRLDKELFDLIALCIRLADETEGAVDITSGALWKTWGFAKRQGQIPSAEDLRRAREQTGSHLLELDETEQTIRFKKQEVELNFGCVGKGFALDVAAEKLRELDVHRFLFYGGLSSMLASGTDWKIGVAHPLRPGQRLRELTLNDVAVSTSGSQKQFFRHGGKRYSHLIDPRSGQPAEKVLTATVLAPTATLAELLSTAFFILGAEKAAEYCSQHPEISAVLTIPRENLSDLKFGTLERLDNLWVVELNAATFGQSQANGADSP